MEWRAIPRLVRENWHALATAGSAQVFAQMIRSGRQIVIPLYAAYVVGLDVGAVGTIVSASTAVDMSLFYPAGLVMDRFGRRFSTIPSFLILSVGMALVPLTHTFITLLGATLVLGLGNGIGSGSMMTLGADLAPKGETGQFLGIWRLIGDSGSTSGPIVVGAIADALGLGAAALVLSGFGLLSAAVFATAVKETLRPREAVENPVT
ncbi:MAG: MFS transporter [Chloroflexota bacterium]